MQLRNTLKVILALCFAVACTNVIGQAPIWNEGPYTEWDVPGALRGKAFPVVTPTDTNPAAATSYVQMGEDGSNPVWISAYRSAGYLAMLQPSTVSSLASFTPAFNHIYYRQAWGTWRGESPVEPGFAFGSRLPINLLCPPSPGDFLDPAPTIGTSSLALVPNTLADRSTAWNGLGRPTIHERVDAITGLPLAKVTDLELPVGGATFRLIRTRSFERPESFTNAGSNVIADKWWDWVGLGWMASENPVLLVDSQVSTTSPCQAENGDEVVNSGAPVRVTRLLLDAHRSIPFQLIYSNGQYETSPRFRAKLTHNGSWGEVSTNPTVNGWITHPTSYKVSLYDGAVTYTFVSITRPKQEGQSRYDPIFHAEDVPPNRYDKGRALNDPQFNGVAVASSYADSPVYDPSRTGTGGWTNPTNNLCNLGFGLPTLGLCTRIEDQYGNAAIIHYAPVRQFDMGLVFQSGTSLRSVFQETMRRGQISHVVLKSGNAVAWTLVYAHRLFAERGGWLSAARSEEGPYSTWLNPTENFQSFRKELEGFSGSLAIDAIYVYPGDISASLNGKLITVGDENTYLFEGNPTIDDKTQTDPLSIYNSNNLADPISVNWKHKVRYFYRFDNRTHVGLDVSSVTNPDYGKPVGAPVLIKSLTTSRVDASNPSSTRDVVSKKVFQYSDTSPTSRFGDVPDMKELRMWGSGVIAFMGGFPGSKIDCVQIGWSERGKSLEPLTNGQSNPWTGSTGIPWLSRIFSDGDLAKLGTLSTLLPVSGHVMTAEDLAIRWSPNQTIRENIDKCNVLASVEWKPSPTASTWAFSGISSYAPAVDDMLTAGFLPEISAGSMGIVPDLSSNLVNTLTVRDGTEVVSTRISRIAVRPDRETGSWNNSDHGWASGFVDGAQLFSSAFVIPYNWSAYPHVVHEDNADMSSSNPAVLVPPSDRIRWVIIADEFSDETVRDTAEYVDGTARKEGQVSRRVLTLNPSGVTMRDRNWNFQTNTTSTAGEGLGKSYSYVNLKNWLVASGGWSNDYLTLPKDVFRQLIMTQERSIGWSTIPEDTQGNQAQTNTGLVTEFEYNWVAPTPTNAFPFGSALQMKAVAIQSGTNNPSSRRYVRQMFHDPLRPANMLGQVDFIEPATTLLTSLPVLANPPVSSSSNTAVSYIISTYADEPDIQPWLERMTESKVIQPPRKAADTSEELYPVMTQVIDSDGTSPWIGSGLVRNPLTIGTQAPVLGESFTMQYTEYEQGRVTKIVEDAVPGSITKSFAGGPTVNVDVPAFPSGWSRIAASDNDNSPLNRLTYYQYNDPRGNLSDIWFPNGRRWAKRVYQHNGIQSPDPDKFPDARKQKHTETFVFSDAYYVGINSQSQQPEWKCLSPFQWELKVVKPVSTRFASFGEGGLGGTMRGNVEEPAVSQRKLALDGAIDPDSAVLAYTIFPDNSSSATQLITKSLTEKQRILNERGQVIETALAERNVSGSLVSVGSRETNNLVDMRRDRDIDGTIHRETRDFFGHWLRRYRGTGDFNWPNLAPNPDSSLANNLVLTERQEWGKGVTDAWLPTVHRRYDSAPILSNGFEDPYAKILPDHDAISYPTVTQYDWRMRPVRVDSYSKGPYVDQASAASRRLSTSLTYLDFQSRPVLEVSFGAGELTLGSLDPVTFEPTFTIPDVSAFFNLGIRPLSITHHLYSKDGTEYETRSYDVGWSYVQGGSVPYQSTVTYRGLNNEVIYSHAAGQPVNIKVQHPAGHILSSITVAPDANAISPTARYELSRTDFIHDPASLQVIDQSSWERTLLTGNLLTTDNAVRTREVTWYDARGRVTATADLGTENPSNTFASTTSPVYQREEVDCPTWTHTPGPNESFVFNRQNVPASARVSAFYYDNEGNQIASVDPFGSITRTWYTGRGMVAKQAEAYGTDLVREKTYEYRWNRLVGLKFQSATSQQPTDYQETRSHYSHTSQGQITVGGQQINATLTNAAPVVDHQFNQISANASLVSKVWFPHRENGSYNLPQNVFYPTTSSDFSFKYNIMGQIAERLDARGVVFRYTYDAQSRLSRIEAGHYSSGGGGSSYVRDYPPEMNCATGIPVDRIQSVEFTYDSRGNQATVTSRGPPPDPTSPTSVGPVITQNAAAYSNRDDLIKEWQSYGTAAITSGSNESPNTQYDWVYSSNHLSPTDPSFNRLTKMTYPMPTGGVTVIGSSPPRREVNFVYGSATASTPQTLGWQDNRFSRITQMTSGLTGVSGTTDISGFEYSGSSRRVTHTMAGGKIARTSRANPASAGLDHLDQFGRAKVFAFNATNGPLTSTPLYRAEYAYDDGGNRTDARIIERGTSQAEVNNQNSVRSSYDDLQRLLSTDHGSIGAGTAFTSYRKDAWSLDLLGNWVGGNGTTTPPGRLITDPSNGNSVLGLVDVTTNKRNEPATSTLKGESSGGGTPLTTGLYHDASGNLVFDGGFYYQYDAWNRLIQINKASLATGGGPVEPESFTSTPCPSLDFTIGPMVKHFTYDGVGRLIRVQSPFPNPESSTGAVRSERFYYDGARRIQEIVTDPMATVGLAGDPEGEANNPGLNTQLNQSTSSSQQQTGDPEGTPLSFESSQMQQQEENPQPLVTEEGEPLPATIGGAEREYIWGPGDGPARVYEILAQFDIGRNPWWMLQDASGDLVAMCDLGSTNSSARVVHTYQFDAYGQCLRASQLVANTSTFVVPYTRLGHKGLFLDRMDVGVASGSAQSGYADNPRVVGGGYGSGGTLTSPTGSIVRYFINNRTLTPEYAIWNQRDPNQSGQVVLDRLTFHGVPIVPADPVVDMDAIYGDGGSLRAYVGSNPWNNSDPFGLFFSLGDVMGAASGGASISGDYNDEVTQAGRSIKSAIQMLFVASAVMDEADLMWAMDWDARDDDYSRTDADYYSGGSSFGQSGPRGPAMAALTPAEEAIVRAAAAASKHGSPKHYGMIAEKIIGYYRDNGLSLKDADFTINKTVRDSSGKTMLFEGKRLRPDAVVYVKGKDGMPGKTVDMILEVKNTQSEGSFTKRLQLWEKYFPAKVTPGRVK